MICENEYILKVIIHHTAILKNSSFRHFYCIKQKKFLNVLITRIAPQVKHFLVQEHRKYIASNLNEITKYDHVGFFENDIGFSINNLRY